MAGEIQGFDFLSCVKFHASSFHLLIESQFVVSDMNEAQIRMSNVVEIQVLSLTK